MITIILKIINIYHSKGFINKAYELVEKYINEGQNNPEFLYLAGFTLFRLQDYEKGEKLLKRAVYLHRNMPVCYQLLSYIYQKQNYKEEMEKSLHNLYVLAPDKIRLLRSLNREENPDCAEICRRYFTDVEDFADIEWDYIPIFNTGTTFEFDLNIYADYIYNFDKIYADLGAED